MAVTISRTQFLRGDFSSSRPAALRPPWAIPERWFIETCNGCGDCVHTCPSGILKAGRGRLPEIDFSLGYCSFCGECAAACKAHALDSDRIPAWHLKAGFSSACLPLQGIACYTCEESCEREAIGFRLAGSAVPVPQLDPDACNGCGACYSSCPAGAIALRPDATTTLSATEGGSC